MAEKKSKLVEIKTKHTAASVEEFINNVESEQKRKDSFVNELPGFRKCWLI